MKVPASSSSSGTGQSRRPVETQAKRPIKSWLNLIGISQSEVWGLAKGSLAEEGLGEGQKGVSRRETS